MQRALRILIMTGVTLGAFPAMAGLDDFCRDVAQNGEGYGNAFVYQGVTYKKMNEDWAHNGAQEFWCRVSEPTPPEPDPPASPELFEHNGQKLFLVGENLGNVQFLPFAQSPYVHSGPELKGILRAAFQDLAASGANSIRFWLHIDGSQSPLWALDRRSGQTVVSGLPAGFVEDLKWLIRTAYLEYGLLVNVTLWSHDVLAVRRLNPVENRARAMAMMTTDLGTDKYIQNALIPMLRALEQPLSPRTRQTYQDAVMSWEILNEPEGISKHWRLYWNYQYAMRYGEYEWKREALSYLDDRRRTEYAIDTGSSSWTPVKYKGWYFIGTLDPRLNLYLYKDVTDEYPTEWDYLKKAIVDDKVLATEEIPYQQVMRFINRVAGAIHREVPGAKVSCGAHSVPYNTSIPMPGLGYENAPLNYYSDQALISAGGDPAGVMDFYQVHGYPEWADQVKDGLLNMFLHTKPHWKLDKPLVVGEHWSLLTSTNETVTPGHYERLHDNGYAGVWGWAYFHVQEYQDRADHQWKRRIVKHVNQDIFRDVLENLPRKILYPVATPTP